MSTLQYHKSKLDGLLEGYPTVLLVGEGDLDPYRESTE